MSQDVRVSVRLGSLRVDYAGSQAFYESKVEALVAAAAGNGAKSNGAPAAGPSANGAPPEPQTESAEQVATRGSSTAETASTAFVPKSPEFGRFVRRLGPEAAEPDRQVVALAFYLWNYERKETFSEVEIAGCFRALGLPPPGDLDAIFADLGDRKRFLEPAGSGVWRLSKKGENYVKTRLLAS